MGGVMKAIGSIFSPKVPEIKQPTMPDPDSAAAQIAATKKIQARAPKGRAGTIYEPYSGSNLAGTQ